MRPCWVGTLLPKGADGAGPPASMALPEVSTV
jgi:hypothetical protein